jgi:hypothetical protein
VRYYIDTTNFFCYNSQVDEDPDVVPPMEESERMQIQRTNWQVRT